MKLSDKEIKALAHARMKSHKEIAWNRKYTIPYYVAVVIAVVSFLMSIDTPSEAVMVSGDGNKVVLTNGESIVVNGVEYIRDRNKESGLKYLRYIGLGASVLAGVVYYKWSMDLKHPYIKRFTRYYKEYGELLD